MTLKVTRSAWGRVGLRLPFPPFPAHLRAQSSSSCFPAVRNHTGSWTLNLAKEPGQATFAVEMLISEAPEITTCPKHTCSWHVTATLMAPGFLWSLAECPLVAGRSGQRLMAYSNIRVLQVTRATGLWFCQKCLERIIPLCLPGASWAPGSVVACL